MKTKAQTQGANRPRAAFRPSAAAPHRPIQRPRRTRTFSPATIPAAATARNVGERNEEAGFARRGLPPESHGFQKGNWP